MGPTFDPTSDPVAPAAVAPNASINPNVNADVNANANANANLNPSAAMLGLSLRSSTSSAASTPGTGTPSPGSGPRFKRLAAKPLKPLKLAASAIGSVPSRIGGNLKSSTGENFSLPPSQSATPEEELTIHLDANSSTNTSTTPSSAYLEPPSEKKQRSIIPGRRKAQKTRVPVTPLDAAHVAEVAQGPRKPLENEEPAAILRVRVVSAQDLVVKDRNGYSDPFVSVVLAPATRHSTPVIKRTLNPVFPAEQSTFDFPLYLSLAGVIGGRGLEAVVWDKDLMRKEYMGELFVGVDQWFQNGAARLWHDDLPIQSFDLISTRRRQTATGSVQLQIGFLPPPALDSLDALAQVRKVYDTILKRAFLGAQFGVLGVPAHEGIGTIMMSRGAPEEHTHSTKTGIQILTSAMVAPFTGDSKQVVEEYDLDDGLSSSDEEETMEDALEGDEDGVLRPEHSVLRPEHGVLLPEHPAEVSKPLVPETTPDSSGLSTSPRFTWSRRSSSASIHPPAVTVSATPSATPSPPVKGGSSRKLFKKKKDSKGKEYNLGGNKGVLGIVVMEIQSASDLPKLKNSLRLGWDMDPFVVISFGKKVFRTRVIRHSLNPTWDEKLLFHVHDFEDHFNIQMAVLDWDKISGNDMVGTSTLPLADLIADAPQPDPQTGLYGKNVDGKHDSKEFVLPILTAKGMAWEARHSPTLTVKARFEPYDALRQRFWRQYTMQYDADETGTMSYMELTTMLDSLGSTLSQKTIEGYFARCNKSADKDELTFDEVVQCLESEITKTADEKRRVDPTGAVDANELSERLLDSWPKSRSGSGDDTSTTPSIIAASTHPSSQLGSSHSGVPSVKVAEVNSRNETLPATDTASPASPSDMEDVSDHSGVEVERIINIKECPLCRRPRLGKRSEQDIITHLAVCASSDWSRVNRIVTASYVTSSQAQRKLVTKLINKVAIGTYSLGANSANILVQDRLTGQLQEEKMAVYVRIGIRVLYKGARGQMAGARARKLLKSLSVKQGLKYDSPASAAEIPGFIEFHNLNVDEIRDPLDSFKTFNEFFYRKLKPEARPLDEPDNPYRFVSAADCRMMAFETVSEATQIWIKGRDFSVSRLLGPNYKDQVDQYDGGALVIFRLAPQDYHRFHSPVDGKIGKMTMIAGEYYTVNPQAIRTSLDVYGENVRKIVPIESEEFGTVMTVWVGAMMVGSIGTEVEEGQSVKRLSPLGWFAFGGSTIVCLVPKGRVQWDEDLLANGRASIETLVRVGMGIGRAPGSPGAPRRESASV